MNLSANEEDRWKQIAAFPLDQPGAGLSFSQRLARENGWDADYTQRVIEEYRKFIFLCAISESGVTPSDPVDQAWHLHLTYTKSYWNELCGKILGKEIHHNPTQGGREEGRKFDGFYSRTFSLYKEKFGHVPPADIWPDNQTRFSDIDFRRVNLRQYWLLKKPGARSRKILFRLSLVIVPLLFIQAKPADALLIFGMIAVLICVAWFSGTGGGNGGSGCGSSACGFSGCGSSGCSGCGGGCGGCGS